jgi:NitT/TauT family transport system substrate-binding protein
MVPGSKAIYTSADEPGLIYDVYAASPKVYATRKADLKKLLKVWYRAVNYFYDPKTREDAIKIMASRVNLKPDVYKTFVNGTKILTLKEAKQHIKKGSGFSSVYGSSKIADEFNVANKVYKQPQDVDSYFDFSLTESMK